jgi:tRNA (cmo5U34)-methyltransferase
MSRDEVTPASRWVFDVEVADAFDDMLSRSIPQYEVMREAVASLASRYVQPGGVVVDLGCSRGEALASIAQRVDDPAARFVGTEVSQPMLDAARERFADDPRVEVQHSDLRAGCPDACGVSVTLLILTLQFTPIEYRQRIVQDVFDATRPGGAVILVEKVLGASAHLDRDFVDVSYNLKERNGYSRETIDRKRLSLEGVLVPVTARWNEELLAMAGFGPADCFWRWMNFAGWIAIKGRA